MTRAGSHAAASTATARTRGRIARQMQSAVGDLTKVSLARMEKEMPWFAGLTAEQRAWIGMILQAGYSSFIGWFKAPSGPPPPLNVEVFGNAPRSFAGVISLQQTVAMVRLSIEVAEQQLAEMVSPEYAAEVRESVLRYGRELAFATADVYAHAAEIRGAWDARLEALVVDSIMRGDADETVRTRASALGWGSTGDVVVVVGRAPDTPGTDLAREGLVDEVRESARRAGLDALGAVQGDRLVVVVGGVSNPDKAGALIAGHFGEGPVVVGRVVPDLLQAHMSAAEAVAGLRAAVGWPATPGLVTSEDLLAERALDGDPIARRTVVTQVYRPLRDAGSDLLETVTAVLDQGGSIEGAARVLFVHPNTVRYRLKRALEITGLSATDPRGSWTLQVALALSDLDGGRSLWH
jgi:hypothetical protein